MNMKTILGLSLLLLTIQFAEASDGRDYGYLSILPGGQQLVSINDGKNVSLDPKNFEKLKIESKDQSDVFSWQVPKSGEKQALVVERERASKRVLRITRSGTIPGRSPKQDVVITSRLKAPGVLQSYTVCSEEYKTLVGIKTKTDGNNCSTWNKDSCAYVTKIIDDGELSQKINECNGLLKSIGQHQERLANLVTNEYQEDVKAIKNVTGKKNQKNSFELSADSVGNISQIYNNYVAGAEICQKLNTSGDARFEDSNASSSNGSDNKKATQQ
jgi:hypothetical protein